MITTEIDNLLSWFEEKGIQQEEFPYFFKDVTRFIDEKGVAPLQLLNHELETLGWGIQVMDEIVYHKMIFLHQNRSAAT